MINTKELIREIPTRDLGTKVPCESPCHARNLAKPRHHEDYIAGPWSLIYLLLTCGGMCNSDLPLGTGRINTTRTQQSSRMVATSRETVPAEQVQSSPSESQTLDLHSLVHFVDGLRYDRRPSRTGGDLAY